MTLRTALILDGHSAGAEKALAGVEASIGRAEEQARKLAAAGSAADIAISRLASAQTAAKVANDAAKASFMAGDIGLEEYNRTLLETRTAVDLVAAKHREAVTELRRAQAAYDQAAGGMGRLGAVSDQTRMGMQQLGFQLGDMATMFALGARPMQIFASQSGQVIQAVQMMTGGTSRLANFLGGPWGIGLMVATTALTPFVGQLFEAEKAAQAAELGADGLRQAQGVLGDMFDLTSGKLERQNDLLRLNARLTAMNLRAEAGAARASAKSTFGDFRQGSIGLSTSQLVLGALGIPVRGAMGRESGVRSLLRDFDQGRLSPEAAVARAEKLDFSGLSVTREQFIGAFVKQLEADAKETTAAAIDASLNNNSLDPQLRRDAPERRDRRPRAPKLSGEERARRQANEDTKAYIASLQDEIAKIGLNEAALRQLEVQKAKDAAVTDEQRRAIEDLNQQRERAITADADKRAATAIAEENKQIGLSIAALEREASVIGLSGWARERALLTMEHEAQLRPLLVKLAEAEARGEAKTVEELRKKIELLKDEHAWKVQAGAANDNLVKSQDRTRELTESYRELAREATGALSDIALRGEDAADVMKRLALSIADAALEALLLGSGPLAAVFGTSGGGGGLVGSLFGSVFGGKRETGGPISPGKFYAVNERSTAPGLFLPLGPGRIDPPGNDNGRSGSGGVIEVRIVGSELLHAEIRQVSGDMAVSVVQQTAPAIMEGAVSETARLLGRPRL